ncbi:MAG: hypothetical protein AAGF84_04520 [Planctomycetota bacterium]
MSKSSALVLLAVLGSAAIVALAWTLGGPAELSSDDELAAPQFKTPAGLRDPGQAGQSELQRIERAQIRSELEDGRVQVFSFASVEPRSDFVSDFTEPRAELYLTGGRLVTIAAASGTFQHPGNVPTNGRFDSEVVVTFFEAADDASLNPEDPAQIVFRLFLDDTTDFDRDEGRIVTEGPVHLTGPAATFRGRGLRMTYSADDERVTEMIVDRGEELRLRRDSDGPADRAEPDSTASVPRSTEAIARGQNERAASVATTKTQEATEPPQFYQARFDRDVLVRVGPDDEARLTGDALEIAFAFVEEDRQAEEANEAPASTNEPHATDTRLASAEATDHNRETLTDAVPGLPVFDDTASDKSEDWFTGNRELFSPRDDDVRITWAGPLTLYPLDGPPTMLQNTVLPAEPDDALLTLLGTPATVVINDVERPDAPTIVAADSLAYATATGRLQAVGSTDRPFRMDAPGQGTLTGQGLDFCPDAADFQADVAGPGRLVAMPTDTDPANAPLDVQFVERMRLAFADTAPGREHAESPLDDLGRLSVADFAGEVHAIAADPDRPDEPPLDLTAEELRVDFAEGGDASNDDSPLLRRIHAQRNVLAQHAGRSLAADDLVADFATQPDKQGDPDTTLTRVTATGNTTALLPDEDQPDAPATTLTAHQLVATPDPNDPEAGTLLLLADESNNNAAPARITTPTAVLTGPRLLLNQTEQSLQAQGPGRLTQTQDDESLAIAFTSSLDYHGNAQPFPTADAVGNVRAQRTSPTQAARLESHRLALTFFPTQTPSTDASTNNGATPLPTLQLRTAHATANPADDATPVELAAQTHPIGQPEAPVTRLTVFGPDVFLTQQPTDDLPPHAQVTGQGQLRLEDYTEPTPDDEAEEDETSGGLQLAGQGVTLFRWTDRLYVDLTTNDLTMYGRVGMNHNPLDGQPNVLLVADRLRADLTEDPPFTQMLAADPDVITNEAAEEPALRQVQLDGRVIVHQDTRRVFADQLLFTADDRNVLVQAYPGGTVRAEDTREDLPPVIAEAFEWNLDRDRLKVTDYRGGLVPIE